MGMLDKLLGKMKEEMPEKKKGKSTMEGVRETFPSTEELQSSKESRKEKASRAAEYLGEKGYPTLGALAGTAIDISGEMIPGTQEEYLSEMGQSIGTIGKPSMKIKPLKPDAELLGKRWAGLSGEERAAWNNNRAKYIEDQLRAEEIVAAQADNARTALKEEVRSSPKGESDVSAFYSKTKEVARPMDPTKKFGISKLVDANKAMPKASTVIKKEPEIMIPKFRQHKGLTEREKKILRQQEADDLARRKKMGIE